MTIPYNISLTGIGEHLMEHMIYFKEIETKKYMDIVPKEAVVDEKSYC